jgi:catechol 2,3-dioxygenase-like lactoylglutathione lyase family enzyme
MREGSVTISLDHVLVPVEDVGRSSAFYGKLFGFKSEPYGLVRISPTLVLQLIERPPQGSQHFAFSMSGPEFERTIERLKVESVPFGDNFDSVGKVSGPGTSHGSQKDARCLYFRDPDGHMLEIMHYPSLA